MKRLLALFLVGTMFFSFSPQVFARTNTSSRENIIICEDGVITVTLHEYPPLSIATKSVNELQTKTGSKTYTKTANNGSVLWTAVLTGTFTYDGSTSTCIAANCNVTIYGAGYSLSNKQVSKAGNTAIGVITIVYKILGITISSETHTLTLTCDSAGNLS